MNLLSKEVGRIGRVKIRVHHVLSTIILCVVVFLVGLAIGVWFGAYHYPYRTLPRPPVPPGQKAPACSSTDHTLGQCLPKPVGARNAASITATTQGPDFSNNNPVESASAWDKIAAHNSYAIFKVTEGTGFTDGTAATMARFAKARGLMVGGYDFLHICGDNPTVEAQVFVSHLKADGLTGRKTFPGIGDAEFGGGCDARTWILAWVGEVRALTGRTPLIYTGAWYWQPHLGAFWPNPSLSWISGYGVRYPYMPSGRSVLDLWQFQDRGFNGYNASDLSTWRDGAKAFTAYTNSVVAKPAVIKPKPKPLPRAHCFGRHPQHNRTCRRVHAKIGRLKRQIAAVERKYR